MLEEKIYFSENQKFNKWWHWLIVLSAPTIIFILLFVAARSESDLNNEQTVISLWFSTAVSCVLIIWFYFLKLETVVNAQGIHVKFKGIPFAERIILFDDLEKMEMTSYSGLTDYGGWGVRYSLSGNGWCYTVSGKAGIKITYKNSKKLLIGTQKPEELQSTISALFKSNR